MNKKDNTIILFNKKQVRCHWNEEKELWYFSVVDVVEVLTDSPRPRKYWNALKTKLIEEGNELSQKMGQLKLESSDGKKYFTDVLDTENILRLIQSISSPKAEPFKLWLAKVGYERIEETEDPELAIDRAMETYLKKGYSKEWINQRLKTIEVRKELTDEWRERGVKKGLEFAILTDEITKASTAEISKKHKPKTFSENKDVAKQGGGVAHKARKDIEQKIGKSVVSNNNLKHSQNKKTKKIK